LLSRAAMAYAAPVFAQRDQTPQESEAGNQR